MPRFPLATKCRFNGGVRMKIRITGEPKQVQMLLDRLDIYVGSKCKYISNPYPQTRKCKTSKYVSVYVDYEDYDLDD